MLNVTNHQGDANQSHSEILPHICQDGDYLKHFCVGEDMKTSEHLHTVRGNAEWCSHYGTEWRGFFKN